MWSNIGLIVGAYLLGSLPHLSALGKLCGIDLEGDASHGFNVSKGFSEIVASEYMSCCSDSLTLTIKLAPQYVVLYLFKTYYPLYSVNDLLQHLGC